MRPLIRAVCQAGGKSVTLASECKGTTLAVELFKRGCPPLQSRRNAQPQGKGSYVLDLSWHAIDRDVWPLGSWNKALGEKKAPAALQGQRQGQRAGQPCYLADLQVPGDHRASNRADFLATELLPRGCFLDFEDHEVRTAIGHWDANNTIFRCAVVCPLCRFRPCNRRTAGCGAS